ncbi:TPA: hypothetical protein ACYLN4_009014, partial [Burkholderia lata]
AGRRERRRRCAAGHRRVPRANIMLAVGVRIPAAPPRRNVSIAQVSPPRRRPSIPGGLSAVAPRSPPVPPHRAFE